MISINSMMFSNILSYGEDNLIRFDDPVTQLIGSNGAGKSSIPIILEEGLFNKNSKGIKKGDLLNKFGTKPTYNISIQFDVEQDHYFIKKEVGTTAKVTLFKNDEEITGHTTTQTYKLVEGILGVDFPTFTKLVYQSMVSSLDFISATDSNRKKFLISLLGLEGYVSKEQALKDELKSSKSKLVGYESSVATISSIIASTAPIPKKAPVPELDQVDPEPLYLAGAAAKTELSNIESKNLSILANLKAKKELNALQPVEEPIGTKPMDISREEISHQSLGRKKSVASSEYTKLEKTKDKCPTCHQAVDISDTLARMAVLENELIATDMAKVLLEEKIKEANSNNDKINRYKTYAKNLETLSGRVNTALPDTLLTKELLDAELRDIGKDLVALKKKNASSKDFRNEAVLNNNLADAMEKQLKDNAAKLEIEGTKLTDSRMICARLEILASAMGNKGLIAYKIEALVKVFEELINEYLQVLSDGEFTLKFIMDDTKLQIRLTSGSVEMDVKSISSGEFNKVNTATLLAVRKMLTAISKIDINLLFLDEVVAVLDPESKDTLIDLLLKETNLNTIVVSHGYTHPLAARLNVLKENKISRLQLDE